MKLASLFSGGKDSAMALWRAIKSGYDVPVLLSMVPESDDSYMYHTPNIKLTPYLARACEIPIVVKTTQGVPPRENLDLKNALLELKENYGIEGITAGAVHSNYQYNIISKICAEINLYVFAPYWQKSHASLIEEAIANNFLIIFTAVSADGMDESWLDRRLDISALEELKKLNRKFGVDIGGEGGEYETLVLDCPLFKKRINVTGSEKSWDGVRGVLNIKRVEFEEKI